MMRISKPAERGAVLAVSLVIVLVLALLGVTAMNTASLENKMAGNAQSTTLAFQAAESGLAKSANAPVSLYTPTTAGYSFGRATASVTTEFKAYSNVRRTDKLPDMYGHGAFNFANFDQVAAGAQGDATSVVHQGMKQLIPKE